MIDTIYRQAAIDVIKKHYRAYDNDLLELIAFYIKQLPSAQSEIIRCKDCKYWNSGTCECREHAVNCQDYMVGDMETDAEHFCGYAEKREVIT